MNRNKRLLGIFALIFTLTMAFFAYDFYRRTISPMERKRLRQTMVPTGQDSSLVDTADQPVRPGR